MDNSNPFLNCLSASCGRLEVDKNRLNLQERTGGKDGSDWLCLWYQFKRVQTASAINKDWARQNFFSTENQIKPLKLWRSNCVTVLPVYNPN